MTPIFSHLISKVANKTVVFGVFISPLILRAKDGVSENSIDICGRRGSADPCRTKKSPENLSGDFSCGRRDLNPHDREATRTLILLVYQFQHFREQTIIYHR